MSNHWTEENVPDQTGKRVLLTGATGGLGLAQAKALARKGAAVTLGVRNIAKGDNAAAEIKAESPGAEVTVRELDLASLGSIERFVDAFTEANDRLDLLINNAGVMAPPLGRTEDGFELQMGINHFGTFALTGRLMPLLKATPGSRVAVTSSAAHRQGDPDLSDLDWIGRKYSPWQAYSDSKLANLLFVYELARRLDDQGPVVTAAHPGWTRTDLQRHVGMARIMNPILAMPISQGMLGPLRAATDPTARNGDFFGPTKFRELRGFPKRVDPSPLAKDPDLGARLWETSERRTGVSF